MKRKLITMLLAAVATSATLPARADAHGKVQLWEGGPYWATTNIGAENPWDSGYYFWWGDTVGYYRENDAWVASDGSSSNFWFSQHYSAIYTQDKSIAELQSEGWITEDNVLTPEHDAAHVQWGSGWRIPTYRELDGLTNKCDWTWTTMHGMNGYVVHGKGDYALNSIFLPCAGTGSNKSVAHAGSVGIIWSSAKSAEGLYGQWALGFASNFYNKTGHPITTGSSIRPVRDADANDVAPEIAATIAAIDAIGEVEDTEECKAKIDAAREAYDALTDGQKALVTNYATLTDAEAAYAAFGQGGETPFTVTRPWTANAKAVLNGAMYDAAGNVAGVAQLKVTKPKVDKKTGAKTVKVSGYLLPNGGKKATLKATVFTILTDAPTEAAIPAKSLGSFRVKIGDDGFLGTAGAYTAHTASVGGKWTRGDAKVTVATSATLPEGTVKSLLPDGVPVRVKGGKWAFDKAASITYKKGALGGDNDPKKPNRSAMKLSYTPKTGLFKGSFKVYAIQSGKLKKYTVKVTGVVVDGEGTGVGKLAKPAVTWSVRVSG